MSNIDDRSRLLLGEKNLALLKKKSVAIFGLGGVGGTAFEALLRTGIGKLIVVDKDVVDASNLNRQILYSEDVLGTQKALVAFLHSKLVRGDSEVLPYTFEVSKNTLEEKKLPSADFILDAIDDINGKIALIEYAQKKNIPILVCLGMGNRIDPSKLIVTTLNQTFGDPLARRLREELKKKGLSITGIKVIFSKEEPLIKSKKPASLIFVPSVAGLMMANYVVRYFIS